MCSWTSAQKATITGSVLDNETLQPLEGIEVNIAAAGIQGAPGIVAYTDVSGTYSAKVEPGDYDVSIKKLGQTSLKKTVTAEAGKTEAVDFLVGLRNTAKDRQTPKDDDMILWAAALLTLIAVAAFLYSRRKKTQNIPQPQKEYKKPPVVASDELSLLKAERDRLKHMMAVERAAFKDRKINEERLMAVISDYEHSLDEVKRKISELESA
jgi:hypothetical protein